MQLHEHYHLATKETRAMLEFVKHARQSNLLMCYINKSDDDTLNINDSLAYALLQATCPHIIRDIPVGRIATEIALAQRNNAALRADIQTLQTYLTYPIKE
ncbi:hypothetical protein [Photobacterium carnosum]|uniref:hypothetical protein n=1 Tax=Photobacterium carnosum TaxID=2023717 RepID=UPI001E2C471A|nr:hypothetical protein [Photobacterium carnosum]MCD9500558.1 hypothetical protein [Photobacterium carnosum]